MTTDITERLRAEEARMQTLYEYVCTQRDKHQGHAFTDFNQVKHAISGRDPVLEPAADTIEALRRDVGEMREALEKVEHALQVTPEESVSGSRSAAKIRCNAKREIRAILARITAEGGR